MIYYFEGDAIELTGRTIEIHGGLFHFARFIEGYRHSQGLMFSDRIKKAQEYARKMVKPQSTKR